LRDFSDSSEDRMNIHKNARLTPSGRERIVRQVAGGQTPEAVAEAAGVCPRTVRKWVDRYRREGPAGLQDRSSRPHQLYRPTAQAIVEQVEQLRRQRHTGKQIAAELGISPATVSRILRRLGLNKLSALEPAEPIRRYEREHPGELIHIDIKKLGRIDGIGHRITGDRRGQRKVGQSEAQKEGRGGARDQRESARHAMTLTRPSPSRARARRRLARQLSCTPPCAATARRSAQAPQIRAGRGRAPSARARSRRAAP